MNLLFVTISFILGTYFYACTGAGYIAAGFVCVSSLCVLWNKKESFKDILIFLLIAALAFCYAAFCDLIQNKNCSYFRGQTCSVEGRISAIAYSDADVDAVTIKTSKIESDRLRLSGKHTLLLYVRHDEKAKYSYGDIISVRAEMSSYYSNPSNFNYALYTAAKGINLSGFASEEDIKILGSDIKWWHPYDAAYKVRQWANALIEKYISYPENQVVKGMITGDKTGLPDDIYTSFRKSGIAHVIAVSGMHLGIILTILMTFMGFFHIKRRVFSVIFYIASIWFFVIITGMPMSAVRSALMITLYFTATLLRREETGLYSLALAMLIILLVNPFALFDAGLALSASATLSLILFSSPLSKILNEIMPLKLSRMISASLSAQLGTIPVCVMEFSSLSLLGVITNLLIYFLIAPVMWGGVLLLTFSFFEPAAKLLGTVVGFLAKIIIFIAEFVANIPFSVINIQKPDAYHLLLYFIFFLFIYFALKKKVKPALFSGLGVLAVVTIFSMVNLFSPKVSVTFFDTKGDGGALVLSGDDAVLIDGGGSRYSFLPENEIIEELENKKAGKVSAFITRPDVSRCGAYPHLMEKGYIERIFLDRKAEGNFKKEILDCAAKNNIKVYYTADGCSAYFEKLKITTQAIDGFNNYRMEFGEREFLFAGGIPDKIIHYSYECDVLFMTQGAASFKNCESFIMEASPWVLVTNDSISNFNLNELRYINPKSSGKASIYLNPKRITDITLQRDV